MKHSNIRSLSKEYNLFLPQYEKSLKQIKKVLDNQQTNQATLPWNGYIKCHSLENNWLGLKIEADLLR